MVSTIGIGSQNVSGAYYGLTALILFALTNERAQRNGFPKYFEPDLHLRASITVAFLDWKTNSKTVFSNVMQPCGHRLNTGLNHFILLLLGPKLFQIIRLLSESSWNILFSEFFIGNYFKAFLKNRKRLTISHFVLLTRAIDSCAGIKQRN